jgi:dihydroneopterin aldolase
MGMASEHVPLMGWLHLRGLRCVGRHGAYGGEQENERVFLVDVAVRLDIRAAAEEDSLSSALDLAALGAAVREVVAGRPRTLIEAVAVDVARDVLRRFPAAHEVRVRLAKPDPPGLGATEEAVEVALGRN